MASAVLRLDRSEEQRLMREAQQQLQRIGMGERMHELAGNLALGPQRLMEIARALCTDPSLLLLDEPAAGLRDASVYANLRSQIAPRWVLLAGASTTRLLGPAADSPLVRQRSTWSLNGGLMAMCVLSLLPVGLMQTLASVDHGYWYARSSEFLQTPLMQTLRWMRVPGDTIFFLGAVALVLFVAGLKTGHSFRRTK